MHHFIKIEVGNNGDTKKVDIYVFEPHMTQKKKNILVMSKTTHNYVGSPIMQHVFYS